MAEDPRRSARNTVESSTRVTIRATSSTSPTFRSLATAGMTTARIAEIHARGELQTDRFVDQAPLCRVGQNLRRQATQIMEVPQMAPQGLLSTPATFIDRNADTSILFIANPSRVCHRLHLRPQLILVTGGVRMRPVAERPDSPPPRG